MLKMKQPDSDLNFVVGATPMFANRLQTVASRVTGDVTFKQWLVLLIIRDMPEGSSATEIAQQHGSTRQNVIKILSELSRQGYVNITTDDSDKRSYAVFLTQKSREEMGRISVAGEEFVLAIFEGIDRSDIAATRRVIMQLILNLDQFSEKQEV